jgi:hypothetical protein
MEFKSNDKIKSKSYEVKKVSHGLVGTKKVISIRTDIQKEQGKNKPFY